MSSRTNVAVKLEREVCNGKNLSKQDKLCVSAKVQKHHLHSNSFTSGSNNNLQKDYSEKESLMKSGYQPIFYWCNLPKSVFLKSKTNPCITEKLPEE